MALPSIYSIERSHERWPVLLSELPEKAIPKKLYVRGSLPPADTLIVGVVGTRRPSNYGKDAAREIASSLARNNIAIVSGMAIGIDSIAHRAALETGTPTIAVLGNGLNEDVIYPKENIELARQICASNGALISEYEPTQKPELWTFPQRNRIIAGIAKAVIVIEAGEKSGALITARFATEYGREVFTLPGQIYNSMSKGTNSLIKQGATPITSLDDLLETLGLRAETKESVVGETPEENAILAALEEELPLDEIIKKTHLAAGTVLAATTSLEIRGAIRALGGGMYRKII